MLPAALGIASPKVLRASCQDFQGCQFQQPFGECLDGQLLCVYVFCSAVHDYYSGIRPSPVIFMLLLCCVWPRRMVARAPQVEFQHPEAAAKAVALDGTGGKLSPLPPPPCLRLPALTSIPDILEHKINVGFENPNPLATTPVPTTSAPTSSASMLTYGYVYSMVTVALAGHVCA